jgi:hypothetical protein
MLAALLLSACIATNVSTQQERQVEGSPDVNPLLNDADHDGTVDAYDCRPDDGSIHPGAAELCDGLDNDCDWKVDEDDYDLDDDGYDDVAACYLLGDVREWDCNDQDPLVHPGARETCDYVDENCDGEIDNGDYDGDGEDVCLDCDDDDGFINSSAAEACDGIDNDCDGEIDELWDFDGDGYSACQGDCDDDDPEVHPGVRDPCDGVDNDCDGRVDEDNDLDGDGVPTCEGDCDDFDARVYPGAEETCDGVDNDCDPTNDENADADGDGYTLCTGDCDDSSASAKPGGTEVCDGLDNDCNGYTDELPECFSCSRSGDYDLCSTGTDWETAAGACEAFGGYLVTISSSGENDDVAALAVRAAWIGANDRAVEGDWVWTDGTSVGYDSFATGYPTTSDASDCAITNNGGRRGSWIDTSCAASYPFVCEY